MPKFMLILHDSKDRGYMSLSPEEMQNVIQDFRDWARKTAESGAMLGGEKLADEEGRRVKRGPEGTIVLDGPFSETKEVVGGFFLIEAADYAAATAIAGGCPQLSWGWVEVRQLDPHAGSDSCALGEVRDLIDQNREAQLARA